MPAGGCADSPDMRFVAFCTITLALMAPSTAVADAPACSATPSLEAAARDARVVFVGEVLRVDAAAGAAYFEIDWQWKGQQTSEQVEVTFDSEEDGNPTGPRFALGERYLVFTRNAFAPFIVDACAPHRAYPADAASIPPNLWAGLGTSVPYRPAAAPPPEPVRSLPSSTELGSVALASVAALLLGRTLVGRIRKRRAEGPSHKVSKRKQRWLRKRIHNESGVTTHGDRAVTRMRLRRRRHRARQESGQHKR